jgi:hypothetical protein
MKTVASLLILSLTSSAALAEATAAGQIASLRVSGYGTEKTVLFESAASNWGIAGCPAAKWAYVRNNIALQEILAVALSAKLSGSTVTFIGECDPDGLHFSTSYIYLN